MKKTKLPPLVEGSKVNMDKLRSSLMVTHCIESSMWCALAAAEWLDAGMGKDYDTIEECQTHAFKWHTLRRKLKETKE